MFVRGVSRALSVIESLMNQLYADPSIYHSCCIVASTSVYCNLLEMSRDPDHKLVSNLE